MCLLKSHHVLKESPTSGEFACVSLGDSFHTPWLFNPRSAFSRGANNHSWPCQSLWMHPATQQSSSRHTQPSQGVKYCCSNMVCLQVQNGKISLTANTCSCNLIGLLPFQQTTQKPVKADQTLFLCNCTISSRRLAARCETINHLLVGINRTIKTSTYRSKLTMYLYP